MREFDSCKLRRLCGEIYKGTPKEFNSEKDSYIYKEIMNYLNYTYYKQFQYIEEYDSKNNEIYLLIRNK